MARHTTPAHPRRGALLAAVFAAVAVPATAQTTSTNLTQDQIDLQGRSSLLVGAGARAFGMGGAFLARADDATASSWNPAGLSYLRRPEISFVLRRSDSYAKRNPPAANNDPRTDDGFGNAIDFFAVAHPVRIGSMLGSVQVSFQRTTSFRGERLIMEGDVIRRLSGEGGFDVIAIGSGLQVTRKLRAGATVNRWFNGYHQTIQRFGRRSTQDTDFTLDGWNANAGLIWAPLEPLNVGLVVKTAFTSDVTLARSRTDYLNDTTNSATEITTNSHTSEDVSLDLPAAVGLGLSWRPRSTLTLSADYTRTFWSRARIRNFFQLFRTEKGELPPAPRVFPELGYPTFGSPSGQSDTSQARAGLEHVIIGSRATIPLRVGVFTDRQHFLDSSGKAPRFFGFTAGVGVVKGRMLVDVAYVHERGTFDDATGHNRVRLHQLLASLIFRTGS